MLFCLYSWLLGLFPFVVPFRDLDKMWKPLFDTCHLFYNFVRTKKKLMLLKPECFGIKNFLFTHRPSRG